MFILDISPVFGGFPPRQVANFINETGTTNISPFSGPTSQNLPAARVSFTPFFGSVGSAPFIYGPGFPVYNQTYRQGPVGYNPFTSYRYQLQSRFPFGYGTAGNTARNLSSYLMANSGRIGYFDNFTNQVNGYMNNLVHQVQSNYTPINIMDNINNFVDSYLMSQGIPPLSSYPMMWMTGSSFGNGGFSDFNPFAFESGTDDAARSVLSNPGINLHFHFHLSPTVLSDA